MDIRLRFYAKPIDKKPVLEWKTVPRLSDVNPLLAGTGDVTYTCGNCGRPVAYNIWPFTISNVYLRCSHCNVYNDVPDVGVEKLVEYQKRGIRLLNYPFEIGEQLQVKQETIILGSSMTKAELFEKRGQNWWARIKSELQKVLP